MGNNKKFFMSERGVSINFAQFNETAKELTP